MDFKKVIPHLIALFVLLCTATLFFAPNAFSGKVLSQSDNDKARGMQAEIQQYLEKGDDSPLWTNSAFGGMPSFQVYVKPKADMLRPLVQAPFLWQDMAKVWSQMFAAMAMMYLFLMVLRLDWRAALLGALAYGVTTYNIDIIEAGHSTKMAALAFMPGILAAMVLLFRGNYLLGGGLLAFMTAAQIYVNHLQITYYTYILVGIYALIALIESAVKGEWANWGKSVAVLALAAVVGVSSGATKLWTTWEYGKETIRGKSELAQKADKGDGLDIDYAFGWSYGKAESMTLLAPHFAGGGANEAFKDSKLYKMAPPEARQGLGGYFYTGDQDFVGTAIYYGAAAFFLFVLGLLVVPGRNKWWLLTGALFMVSVAWGKNFFLNYIWFDYLPLFNKFRAVSMALGVGQMCVAALAALSIQHFINGDQDARQKQRSLLIATGISVAFVLLAFVLHSNTGKFDEDIAAQDPKLLEVIQSDRADMLSGDIYRSIMFIILAAGVLWAWLRGWLRSGIAVLLVAAIALFDHWTVCTRSLTSDKYRTAPRTQVNKPAESNYDKEILADKDQHYRVYDMVRGGITGNATTSYFHKSISGYHAAKLQRFQEYVDSLQLMGYQQAYANEARKGQNANPVMLQFLEDLVKKRTAVFNTKYIVFPSAGAPGYKLVKNEFAPGHAWFVRHIKSVANANEELEAMKTLGIRDTAVVQAATLASLQGFEPQYDSTATIRLTQYHPDRMSYEYSATTDQFALFPEMYYPPSKGWKCYLNGQPAPDFIKADYLLRGMRLPAGQNQKLEMRFEPDSYSMGSKISPVAAALVLLSLLGGLFLYFRKGGGLGDASNLTDPEPTAPQPKAQPEKRAEIKKRK